MNRTNRYYVAEPEYNHVYNAGILRKHNESILLAEGFEPLYLSDVNKFSAAKHFFKYINVVNAKSVIIFHFPIHSSIKKLFLSLLKWRKIATVAIVVDIDGIRDRNTELLHNEINLLKKFTHVILHNDSMKNLLAPQLACVNMHVISLFDYPAKGESFQRHLSSIICFAGNASKAAFIFDMEQDQNISFNVYGEGYDAPNKIKNNFVYKGMVNPSDLPLKLEGSFGLVWDGASTVSGDEYMLYNNPHKLSLYFASGLPVIVWNKSAIAPLVKEYDAGILINSLADISRLINEITPDRYLTLHKNASSLGEKIKAGYYLKKVITQITNS